MQVGKGGWWLLPEQTFLFYFKDWWAHDVCQSLWNEWRRSHLNTEVWSCFLVKGIKLSQGHSWNRSLSRRRPCVQSTNYTTSQLGGSQLVWVGCTHLLGILSKLMGMEKREDGTKWGGTEYLCSSANAPNSLGSSSISMHVLRNSLHHVTNLK